MGVKNGHFHCRIHRDRGGPLTWSEEIIYGRHCEAEKEKNWVSRQQAKKPEKSFSRALLLTLASANPYTNVAKKAQKLALRDP